MTILHDKIMKILVIDILPKTVIELFDKKNEIIYKKLKRLYKTIG